MSHIQLLLLYFTNTSESSAGVVSFAYLLHKVTNKGESFATWWHMEQPNKVLHHDKRFRDFKCTPTRLLYIIFARK